MSWITENPFPLLLIFGLLALALFAAWGNSKKPGYFFTGVGMMALAIVALLTEQVIVTPGEEVEARTSQLCREFQRKDPHIFTMISAQSPELKTLIETGFKVVQVSDDLHIDHMETRTIESGNRVVIRFRIRATMTIEHLGNVGSRTGLFELVWVREAGDWKLLRVNRLNPVTNDPIEVLSPT